MEKKPDYGIIVGRFQVHVLHDGHLELINLVRSMHKRVIIFLGVAPFKFTQSNPLDFITRKRMIEGKFPDVTCLPIYDTASDKIWSGELDKQIALVSNGAGVTLYGGRDSFVSHYMGHHKPVELQLPGDHSGTKQRASVNSQVLDSPEFRQGIIYAIHNRYPIVIPTVDVAIVDGDKVLLAKKDGESGFRFPGGIIETADRDAGVRVLLEISEETGVCIGDLLFLGAFKIDDWRLGEDNDSIMTLFFRAKYLSGAARGGDDVSSVSWESVGISKDWFVPEHRQLIHMLRKSLGVE